ncbi:MAG TPA: class I tRNA ligase family protein, partial [Candidatus Paceibacterota bacterium]
MSEEKDLNNKKSDLASAEEVVLDFWQKNQIFKKSTEKKSPSGEFVFYEGPPTANGKPGIHHLEARAFKDIIPRYKTMKGFNVRRKGGWDTHGLPVELQVEKQLGLKSKKEIEDYGVEKFNQKCRESVWEYLDLWNNFTDRIGYWVDRDNPYITYDNSYIESVWNILKTVDGKNLLYKDYKVLPWCPRCGTALSSHELAQGYEEVKDLSVYVKFKVKNQEDTFILAWTTTPWTLPGNVGLAVNPNITYVEVEVKNISTELDQKFILAKSRLESVVGNENFKIIREMSGEELVGLEYEPLYHYLSNKFQDKNPDGFNKAYKIYSADFVNIEDGTGVVHIAPMYGQDDFELGTKNNLPKFHLVNEAGVFVDGCDFLSGKFVKDEGVVVDIIKDLAHKDLLFKKEKYTHTYPHCWRCHTPLIYYARDSWYIKMSSLRGELLEANKDINWEPSHIREGRFGEWLKEVKDWAISRERYWGTPLPIWQNSEGQITVIGSIDELKQKTKKSGNTYTVMRHGEAESNVAG